MVGRTGKISHRKKSPSSASKGRTPVETSSQPNSVPSNTAAFIEPDRRRAMIADAAYYRAARRDFGPGRELEDWYLAESEIDTVLARSGTPTGCGG
jgi:hypothetical protein